MSLPEGTRLGPYEIIGLVGAGGMARCIARAIRALGGKSRSRFFPPPSRPTAIACGVRRAAQLVQASVSIYGYSDVSPDGRSIAMLYDGKWVVCDFPDCTDRNPISFRAGIPNERWMPDGRGICYVDRGTDPGLTPNVFVQPIDGSAPRQLTHFTDRKSDRSVRVVSRRSTARDVACDVQQRHRAVQRIEESIAAH